MAELLMVWGNDRDEVAGLCNARAAGREYRVIRRDQFALVSVESTDGSAIDSQFATYCIIIQIA